MSVGTSVLRWAGWATVTYGRVDKLKTRVGKRKIFFGASRRILSKQMLPTLAWNRAGVTPAPLNVENFSYLGARVSTKGGGDEDIHERLRKAQVAFRRLSKSWNSSVYSTTTKVRLFNSLVKAVLLHGCETWKITAGNKKTHDTFQTKCLRRIYNVFWPNVVNSRELLSRSNGREIIAEVMKRKCDSLGHILRRDKDDHCQVAITWAKKTKRKIFVFQKKNWTV